MRMDKHKITSILLAFFIFMVINLPSLKVIYSSSILNVIALGGLWTVGFLRAYLIDQEGFCINHYKLNYIMQLMLIWTVLFWVTLIQNPSTFTLGSILKFASVILFALGTVLFARKSELSYVYRLQLVWGIFLALSEATIGIPKDRSLGQNYLVTGVPIALTIVMLFGYIYSKNIEKYKKILTIPIVLILYTGLLSLKGRAPVLFSAAVPLLIVFVGLFYEKIKLIKYLKLIVYLLIVVICFYLLFINIPDEVMDRFLRMFVSITEEPRFEVYLESIAVITDNPQGLGLQGYTDLGLGYPHNIFLEMFMSGGYVMIIPIAIFMVMIFKTSLHSIQYKEESVIWLAMLLYLFLTWNVSFELSGSYMLFSTASLYVVSTGNILYERKQRKRPVLSAEEWVKYDMYSANEDSIDR